MSLLDRLVVRIDQLSVEQARVLVGVDGPDAAGKTTLADALASRVLAHAVRASIDGFHHPRVVRTRLGDLSPDGYYRDGFDVDQLKAQLLTPFSAGAEQVQTAAFDHRADRVVAFRPTLVPDRAVLVVDGVFLLRTALRGLWTYAIYVHVDPDVSLARALVRDAGVFGSASEVRRRYTQRYLPGQELYRLDARPLEHADVVIDNTDPGEPRLMTIGG